MDINMLAITIGCECSAVEYAAPLTRAGLRLREGDYAELDTRSALS